MASVAYESGGSRGALPGAFPAPAPAPVPFPFPAAAAGRRLLALLVLTAALSQPALSSPRRIVSTAPSITETLFALGVGDRVVGVSRFCNYPPQVRSLARVGSYLKPDIEAIARLTPDLVILQQGQGEPVERLNALHITSIVVPHRTLDDIYAEIQLIGQAAGVPGQAASLVSRLRSALDAIRARARPLPSPRVLVIVGREQGTLSNLIAAGPDNYIDQILEIAGGRNVLARSGLPQYPRISLETVLREDPEVIIDLSGTQESEAARRASRADTISLWGRSRDLAAVRGGRVFAGTTDALVVPGPRTPDAVRQLFDILHGTGGAD